MKASNIGLFSPAILLIISTIAAAQQPQSPATHPPTISVTLTALKEPVKVGSRVIMNVVMTNKSTREIHIMRDAYSSYYLVDAVNEKGESVQMTRRGAVFAALTGRGDRSVLKPEDRPSQGSMIFVTLKPGETWTQPVDVDDFYELNQPGKYIIRMTGIDPETFNAVESNAVTINVTQ